LDVCNGVKDIGIGASDVFNGVKHTCIGASDVCNGVKHTCIRASDSCNRASVIGNTANMFENILFCWHNQHNYAFWFKGRISIIGKYL